MIYHKYDILGMYFAKKYTDFSVSKIVVLKTRGIPETDASLKNPVEAAKIVRKQFIEK